MPEAYTRTQAASNAVESDATSIVLTAAAYFQEAGVVARCPLLRVLWSGRVTAQLQPAVRNGGFSAG